MFSIFPISSNLGNKVVLSHDSSSAGKYRVPQFISSPSKSTTTTKYNPIFHQELSNCSIAYSDAHVKEIVKRHSRGQANNLAKPVSKPDSWRLTDPHPEFLKEAYERCGRICAAYSNSYYLGSLLFPEERKKAIWAIYVWGRTTDELVDGPYASYYTTNLLDKWEGRLEDIFSGKPYDMLDAALTDTVNKFSLDVKPFNDLIYGMRMDISKFRYENFQELYEYCYYVGATIGLMIIPVLGIPPKFVSSTRKIYDGALYFGIANQLTNVLRDVGEDALIGRVYLPQDELAKFGLSDKDIYSRKVSDRWREFMKYQIERARFYYSMAEEATSLLDRSNRWPVYAASMFYQKILDVIEDNDYDNLTQKAVVGRIKKLLMLPLSYSRTIF